MGQPHRGCCGDAASRIWCGEVHRSPVNPPPPIALQLDLVRRKVRDWSLERRLVGDLQRAGRGSSLAGGTLILAVAGDGGKLWVAHSAFASSVAGSGGDIALC